MKARYAIGGIVAAVLLALPAGATASQGGQVAGLAAKQCVQERAQLGKKAFRKRYGGKHTMRACTKRARTQVSSVFDVAVRDCQGELADSGEYEFIDDYGEDATSTLDEAMDECVAEGVDDLLHPEADDGDYELDDE